VRSDLLFVTVARTDLCNILLAPYIAYSNLLAPQAECTGSKANLLRLGRCIEETYSEVAVLKNLHIYHITVATEVGNAAHTQRVLTDVVDLVVAEEAQCKVIHLCNVATDEEGRREERPE